MKELNLQFMDKYKKLDNLFKQCYNSKDGVTEYINQMEKLWSKGINRVSNWEYTYKQLKHVRWVRNQLAHEVGTFDTDIVEHSDLNFVNEFYNSIINSTDPLAVVRKSKGKLFSVKKTRDKENKKQRNRDKRTKKSTKSIITIIVFVVLFLWFIDLLKKCLP